MKQLLTNLKIYILGTLAAIVLFLIYRSMKWRSLNLAADGDEIFMPPKKIIAFWHGRQLMVPPLFWHTDRSKRLPMYALISQHSDGRIIAHAAKILGILSIDGSSSRGARQALKGILDKLNQGFSIAITPDGPRGPIFKAKHGVLRIAQRSKTPIYPVSFSADRRWQFGSWDRMILPKPFSRGVFVVGKPFLIEENLTEFNIEEYAKLLEQKLSEVEARADSYFND